MSGPDRSDEIAVNHVVVQEFDHNAKTEAIDQDQPHDPSSRTVGRSPSHTEAPINAIQLDQVYRFVAYRRVLALAPAVCDRR